MKRRYRHLNPETLPRRRSTAESIAASKMTVLINMGIEIVAALIMAVGLTYLLRYMFHFRHRMVESHFNAFVWVIGIFAVGWGTYIALKLRRHYLLYKELRSTRPLEEKPQPDEPTDTDKPENTV